MPNKIEAVECYECHKLIDQQKGNYLLVGPITIKHHHHDWRGVHEENKIFLQDVVFCDAACLDQHVVEQLSH